MFKEEFARDSNLWRISVDLLQTQLQMVSLLRTTYTLLLNAIDNKQVAEYAK